MGYPTRQLRLSQRDYRRRPRRRMDSPGPMRHDVPVTDRDLKRLADAVRAVRDELGVTQEEFAVLCGVSLPSIQRVESGKVRPRSKTLTALDQGANWTQGSARALLERNRPPARRTPDESEEERPVKELGRMTYDEILTAARVIEKLYGEDEANKLVRSWVKERDELLDARKGHGSRA